MSDTKTYYELNKVARLAYATKYNDENRIKINQNARIRRSKNPEKYTQASRRYYEKNKQMIQEKARAKRKKERETNVLLKS